MRVEKLHFLVHPGLVYYALAKGRIKRTRVDEEGLMEVFRNKINSIGEKELLTILLPNPKEELGEDFRNHQAWVEFARYARERLGRRCVVISSPPEVEREPLQNDLRKALRVFQSRGFEFSTETPTEVWGVSVLRCVLDTYEELEETFNFRNIFIPLQATNAHGIRKEEIDKLARELEVRRGRKFKITDRV